MATHLFSHMMDFEDGVLDEEGVVELFQALVDNGMAWTLQGHYGRTAKYMIEVGLVHLPQHEDDYQEALNA